MLGLINQWSGRVSPVNQLGVRLANARGHVDKLTPCLIARACAGKLIPQDPADEPAEKVWERIRGQQAIA